MAAGHGNIELVEWSEPLSTEQRNREIDTLCGFLRDHIETLASKSNPAAHDAWQLALQHLEPLRAAIARARRAEGG